MADAKHLRVLLIEDSTQDEEIIVLELSRGGYEVQHRRVDTEPAMRRALEDERWDVILCDYTMPHFSGSAALELLRSMKIDIPFIIVSGTVGEDLAVAAMKAGATDYVLKQSLARLCPAIAREVRDAGIRADQQKIEEQLLISDRMASVGTLAAGVAHELNTPLTVVIGNLDLIALGLAKVADEQQLQDELEGVFEGLGDVSTAAERLRHIVSDLKIFSRSSSDDASGPVDIKRVLESSLRMAWNEIRHRARLVEDYGDVPHVEANESRLGQVCLNLIVNAAHSIPPGDSERNQLRIVTKMDPSGRVAMEVHDTGAGISPEHLSAIFDAFFTTKPAGVGTGLGLSISNRIVAAFGGEIQVESTVGQGSVFRVLLPTSSKVAELAQAAPEPAPASRRGSVLIIDDEPTITRTVVRILKDEHDISGTTSALVALQRISAGERFDVILCDLMMPQMTGMELHSRLQVEAPEQAQRMVFLTAGAFTPEARNFLAEVTNLCIDKPFDRQQLRVAINERIRSH